MAQDIVGSKMPSLASEALKPSKAGYGQNGFAGASSDMPGESTRSGFLPGVDLPKAMADMKAVETRKVSANSPPLSFGMDSRTPRNK